MKIITISLLVFAFSQAHAQAENFRCTGRMAEENIDMTFNGSIEGKKVKAINLDLLADDGFHGVLDYRVRSSSFLKGKSLSIKFRSADPEDKRISVIETRFNPEKGNYSGEVISQDHSGKTRRYAVLCRILRAL